MACQLNYERAAQAMVDSLYTSDETAAEKNGITPRSLFNYRRRMETDKALSELFYAKKAAAEKEWAQGITMALKEGERFLLKAFTQLNPRDPDAVHAAAGAFKILHEASVTKQVVDARISRQARECLEAVRAVVSPGQPIGVA